MTRRLGSKERNRIYPYIVQRDGDYCLLCAVGNPPRRSPAPPGSTWDLDHADSNRANWRPENIHAVCYEHHCYLGSLSPGEHKKIILDASIENMRERENKKLLSGNLTLSMLRISEYKDGPVEMKARAEFEPKWVDCGHALCWENPDGYPVRSFINDCARYCGCARTTSKNYYETHVLAPKYAEFEEVLNHNLERVVIERKPISVNGNGHKNGKALAETLPEVKK